MRTPAIVFCVVIGMAASAYAAPCYGTRMPVKKGVSAGLGTHMVFSRYLEQEYGKIRSSQNFFLLSYGVFDWLSLDLKCGGGNIKQRPTTSDELDYGSSFAGGYGLRLRLYDSEILKLVFGFQHISVHPKKTRLGEVRHKAVLDDWQTSLLVSRDFKRAVPYLGLKCSRLDYIHWVEESRKRTMSDLTKSFGAVCGFDFELTDRVWLNLEGQFFDGEACALSLNYSF